MRTFIALELSTEIQQTLAEEQQRMLAHLRAEGLHRLVRPVAPTNAHLTLRFLGETTDAQVKAIEQQLSTVAQDHPRFGLTLTGVGCFPSLKKPSVLWLGIGGEVAALSHLQEEIENLAQSAGFVADRRTFSPHITLARVRRGARTQEVRQLGTLLQAQMEHGAGRPPIPFQAAQVVHFRSQLRPDGPVYTPLTTVSLRISADHAVGPPR